MRTRDRWLTRGMGTSKVFHVCWIFFAAVFLLRPISVNGQGAQGTLSIIYRETPYNITSRTNATFSFDLVGADGTDPCDVQQCSIRCKLDESAFQDCRSCQDSFPDLKNGEHVFYVSANTSTGVFGTSEYRWTVDTVPPTAIVDGEQAYTNAMNVTVNISFSEVCGRAGGFVCTNTSYCDLIAYGAGFVIPSTLKEIERGRVYSLVVALDADIPSGKVDVVIAKSACADEAGNLFQRTENSSFVIHFDRTIPSVNLWTALPSSEVIIDNQPRTIQASNKSSDLIIYLDFTESVTSTAEELLSQLNVSSGIVTATQRKSSGNRRFGYKLSGITNVSVVTVILPGNVVVSRYGTPVPETSTTTFLYDMERPQVRIISTSGAQTKNHVVPVVVLFTEPVFGFTSSSVSISGGTLTSFQEVSKTTYTLEVYVVDNNQVTVAVPENRSLDIAGNSNLASPILQVRHYAVPAVSVVLYSLTTAGLLSTAFVSGALSISSATLEAVGAFSGRGTYSHGADPSRNLLGMACHLQVIALSDWLAVSLPIEYREVSSGLRWLVPHVNTPWQDDAASSNNSQPESNVVSNVPTFLQDLIRGRRRLLAAVDSSAPKYVHKGRMLGANTTMYGPALGPAEYELYFLDQMSTIQDLKSAVNKDKGWRNFQRNMFWIGVVGGGFILLHLLTLLFMWLRTKTPLGGALSIPRFELFILILAIPGICQASVFIIKGGTVVGIVVGVLLLVIPAAFIVSVIVFLIYGIFQGGLVKYKEFRQVVQRDGTLQPQNKQRFFNLLAGTGLPGKWIRKNRIATTFLPRYGLLFEDRKGPPKIVVAEAGHKYTDSIDGASTTTESVSSEDDRDDIEVSAFHQALGCARASYILIDLSRRIILGLVFGAYSQLDHSWSQVGIVMGSTVIQLLYLVVVKPFRRRGVQLVETVSLLCEVGIFAFAMVLLAKGDPPENHSAYGIIMLVFLLVSFVAQLVNEWYALLEQLLHLSTAKESSLKENFKMLAGGLIFPFTPRNIWSKFLSPREPPQAGIVSVSFPHIPQEGETHAGHPRTAVQSTTDQGRGLATPALDPATPLYHPGSPAFIDPRTIVREKANDGDSGPPSGEIRTEASPRSERQWSQWGNKRSLEGKRSRGSSKDGKTEELKMLRELAKASFSRRRRDDEYGTEQGMGTSQGGMGTPLEISSPVMSPRGRERRYARRRRQYPGMGHRSREGNTDDSLSEATSDGDTLREDPTETLGDPATLATSSSRSNNKGSGGYSESHSSNLPLRDLGAVIRPLEER